MPAHILETKEANNQVPGPPVERQQIVTKGRRSSQKFLDVMVQLQCDSGQLQTTRLTNEQIANVMLVRIRKIGCVKKGYVEYGVEDVLEIQIADWES